MFPRHRSFFLTLWLFVIFIAVMTACGQVPLKSRPANIHQPTDISKSFYFQLSAYEKLQDFDIIVSYFKKYYAMLHYKEKRFSFNFDQTVTDFRGRIKASQSDDEFNGILAQFLAVFRDGHVDMTIPELTTYILPFTVLWVDGNYIVDHVNDDIEVLKRGDIIEAIGGRPVAKLVANLQLFFNYGSRPFNAHMAAYRLTHRIFVKPQSMMATIRFHRGPNQNRKHRLYLPWRVTSTALSRLSALNAPSFAFVEKPTRGLVDFSFATSLSTHVPGKIASINIAGRGKRNPFFYSSKLEHHFKMVRASIGKEEWRRYRTQQKKSQNHRWESPLSVFSMIYNYDGQNILLIRIPNYNADDIEHFIGTYAFILAKYQPIVDVLVLDQTRNPGGSVKLMEGLLRLFVNQPTQTLAFAPRADRRWLRHFSEWYGGLKTEKFQRSYMESMYDGVKQAVRRGDFFGPPISFGSLALLEGRNVWHKPMMVLTDELCGSGGDAFPMLVRAAVGATIYGNKTAGMSGSVEEMPLLPNSGIRVRLTRSIFFVSRPGEKVVIDDILENRGVVPNVVDKVSMEDFLDDYIPYVNRFSKWAATLVRGSKHPSKSNLVTAAAASGRHL